MTFPERNLDWKNKHFDNVILYHSVIWRLLIHLLVFELYESLLDHLWDVANLNYTESIRICSSIWNLSAFPDLIVAPKVPQNETGGVKKILMHLNKRLYNLLILLTVSLVRGFIL